MLHETHSVWKARPDITTMVDRALKISYVSVREILGRHDDVGLLVLGCRVDILGANCNGQTVSVTSDINLSFCDLSLPPFI